MKTKAEQRKLVKETAKAFNSNNRCVEITDSQSKCVYYAEGKQGCAIGRLIADKDLCRRLDKEKPSQNGVFRPRIFEQLPEEVKAYSQSLLGKLQELHDNSSNWDEEGLSDDGQEEVDQILKEVEEGLHCK